MPSLGCGPCWSSFVRHPWLVAGLAAMVGGDRGQAQSPPASIRGVVLGSLLTSAPLAGATVELLEAGRSTLTDARGVFRFDSLAGGRYTVIFDHPTFRAIGFQAPERIVPVSAGVDVSVVLVTPSAMSIYRRLCPTVREPNTGVLLGTLADASSGKPLPGGVVQGDWTQTTISRAEIGARRPRATRAAADSNGRYQLCGIPTDVPVLLRAAARGTEGPPLEQRLDHRLVAVRNLTLDLRDSISRSTTRVVGTVTASGRPIANAHVTALGGRHTAVTDSAGRYLLAGLPAGSVTLDVRAIGYVRRRMNLELAPNAERKLELELTRSPVELPEVTVSGTAADPSGFEERRRRATSGRFITRADIERRGSIRVEDVFRTLPGIRIDPIGATEYQILLTRGGTGFAAACLPTIYVDRIRIPPDPDSGTYLPVVPEEIQGIEIHESLAGAPIEFRTSNQSCGVILIWTRRGRQ